MQANTILQATAAAFGLAVEDITGRSRRRAIVWARQAAAWLLRSYMPGATLVDVGQWLGGRDHTTVMYYLDEIPGRLVDRPFALALAAARAEIEASLQPARRPDLSFDLVAVTLDQQGGVVCQN